MFSIGLYVIIAALLSGAITTFALQKLSHEYRITRSEFIVGTILISALIVPLSTYAGWKIVQASNLTYYENWNGWERGATRELIKTARDGPGRWTYDCDPYVVMVPYECGDSKQSRTCYRPETRYHQCPYTTYELNFKADTTLGEYDIANNRLPENPNQHRWRRSIPVPEYIQHSAGIGEPSAWKALRERLQQGMPAPVTTRNAYDNYILASETTLFRKHSRDIVDYEAKGLMPKLAQDLSGFINPQRCFAIGSVPEVSQWTKALAYTNASLGSIQCDLYVVLVNDERINSNPDRYALALQAYLLDPNRHGKDALAKNTIVVLIGTTDGKFITYSRAFCGMPRGNENVIIQLDDNLKGLPFAHELILGQQNSTAKSNQSNMADDSLFSSVATRWNISVSGQRQDKPGFIPRILTGAEIKGVRFKRVSMSGKDGQGGYLYLKNEIRISDKQQWLIGGIVFFFTVLVWVYFAMCDGDLLFNDILRKFRR